MSKPYHSSILFKINLRFLIWSSMRQQIENFIKMMRTGPTIIYK